MDPIHLDEIRQIALTVTNLDEARAFYRDVLGMRFLFDAGTMTFFQCGAVRLLIGTAERPAGQERPGGTVLYFRVSDIQGTWAALKAKGAAFIHDPHVVAKMPDHDLWLAEFRDPAGNVLALMSEVARA